MSQKTQNRIHLTIDKQFQEILQFFQYKFPLLKKNDILKMAVSGYYMNCVKELSDEADEAIRISKEQINKGENIETKTHADIDNLF
jgi:hypothetical protein